MFNLIVSDCADPLASNKVPMEKNDKLKDKALSHQIYSRMPSSICHHHIIMNIDVVLSIKRKSM